MLEEWKNGRTVVYFVRISEGTENTENTEKEGLLKSPYNQFSDFQDHACSTFILHYPSQPRKKLDTAVAHSSLIVLLPPTTFTLH